MKLLCCAKCNEIFTLKKYDVQSCSGEHGGGLYVDEVNAKIWGDPTRIFVLGFANTSFIRALRDQIEKGDKEPEYRMGYGNAPMGREFTAFVIPESASSVTRVNTRDEL